MAEARAALAIAERTFLLRRAQPALVGLSDGSLSSLAPLFAVAVATQTPDTRLALGHAARRVGRVARALG